MNNLRWTQRNALYFSSWIIFFSLSTWKMEKKIKEQIRLGIQASFRLSDFSFVHYSTFFPWRWIFCECECVCCVYYITFEMKMVVIFLFIQWTAALSAFICISKTIKEKWKQNRNKKREKNPIFWLFAQSESRGKSSFAYFYFNTLCKRLGLFLKWKSFWMKIIIIIIISTIFKYHQHHHWPIIIIYSLLQKVSSLLVFLLYQSFSFNKQQKKWFHFIFLYHFHCIYTNFSLNFIDALHLWTDFTLNAYENVFISK